MRFIRDKRYFCRNFVAFLEIICYIYRLETRVRPLYNYSCH